MHLSMCWLGRCFEHRQGIVSKQVSSVSVNREGEEEELEEEWKQEGAGREQEREHVFPTDNSISSSLTKLRG